MQTSNRLRAVMNKYNDILLTVREKGLAGEDGYGAVAHLDCLRKMLQLENTEHPDWRLCILLSDLCRAQYRGLEAQTYLEQAIELSPDEMDRERWQKQAEVLNISWHRLPMDLSRRCRKIAFDLDHERCVIAWKEVDEDRKTVTGIAVFKRASGTRICTKRLYEETYFTSVYLQRDMVYLCGLKGMAFHAWTLERIPERDKDCPLDDEACNESGESIELADGLRTLLTASNAENADLIIRARTQPGDETDPAKSLPLWKLHTSENRQGQRWAGTSSMPVGDPAWNALQAKLPAVGLHSSEYAVTTDRTCRYLLLFKRPYRDPADKRAPVLPAGKPYFTIYDTTLFGMLPEDACFDVDRTLSETFPEEACSNADQTISESFPGDGSAAGQSGLQRAVLLGSRRGKRMRESEIYAQNREVPAYHQPGNWQDSRSGILPKCIKTDTCWRCETSEGKLVAEFDPDLFSEDNTAFVYDPGEEIVYSASLGVFAAWDVREGLPCYMGAIDYIPVCLSNVMAYGPVSRPAGEPVTLRSKETIYSSRDTWKLKPTRIFLNRREHATLAVLTGSAYSDDVDFGDASFEIVTVIDLRTMHRIHHELVSRTHMAWLANGKTVGDGFVADVSEDGQVLLWKHATGTDVWFVSEDGDFQKIEGVGPAGSVLRTDGSAYLSGTHNPDGNCGMQEILLDWKYGSVTSETEISEAADTENDHLFKEKDPRTITWSNSYPEILFGYLTRIRALMERTEKEYAAEGKLLPEVDRRMPSRGEGGGFIPEIRMPFLIREIWVKDTLTVMHHAGLNNVCSVISNSLEEKGRFLIRFSGVLPTVKVLVEAPSEDVCELCMQAFIEMLRKYELLKEQEE